jgi:hypothetical protein
MAYIDPITVSPGDIGNAAEWNSYIRDNFQSLGRDGDYIRHIGSTPFECWYPLGYSLAEEVTTHTAVSLSSNALLAYPVVSPRSVSIDRLAFNVIGAGGSTSLARVGIYQATSATNVYPSALIVDGGEQSCTGTGLKSTNVSVTLEPDILYWACYLEGGTSATHTVARRTKTANILGLMTSTSQDDATGLSVAQTYGALPSTFPAGATLQNGGGPMVIVRYSA